jgi:hypothetical protein
MQSKKKLSQIAGTIKKRKQRDCENAGERLVLNFALL